ncbi:hypothetical protein KQH49_09470 [Mycetohabitans sp. B5]|uniref:Uncharacterized protein n=1 Tax=Mycetohabitans endofungorum TaxID=417203 RepID=A0A2P5KBF4_9BURK|nr:MULTISPECIES: hypothetical protein [Mycetohabitans]MCG1055159.1 hypothetical protein [Mycetohabitans sp. B5]PPB84044.1 hypothetical protein B0O95_105230 [Mycetohabitans endofungorum]
MQFDSVHGDDDARMSGVLTHPLRARVRIRVQVPVWAQYTVYRHGALRKLTSHQPFDYNHQFGGA